MALGQLTARRESFFEGAYEGLLRSDTAADWMRRSWPEYATEGPNSPDQVWFPSGLFRWLDREARIMLYELGAEE